MDLSYMQSMPSALSYRGTLRWMARSIDSLSWSPDGTKIAAVASRRLIVWDFEAGNILAELQGSLKVSYSIAWSPDSQRVAVAAGEDGIYIINVNSGEKISRLTDQSGRVYAVSWSHDGLFLASGSSDKTVAIWNLLDSNITTLLDVHRDFVRVLAWSPLGGILASASDDGAIILWNTTNGSLKQAFEGHSGATLCLTWTSDGKILASSGSDKTIRLWDVEGQRQLSVLEGHTGSVSALSFSCDEEIIASQSSDNTVRLWRRRSRETVATFQNLFPGGWSVAIAFHPLLPLLAVLGKSNTVVNIWNVDLAALIDAADRPQTSQYSNAKVVLVGESSTGKTCLARALMGIGFEPQESTHGMKVWTFNLETVQRDNSEIVRETLLWDLAGQTDYQVVHQLFLDETALAVVLFDSSHPENPFQGVGYWVKALKRAMGDDACSRILVAGRVDRGYPTVNEEDVLEFALGHSFVDYIATSAKTGLGVDRLRAAISNYIPWDKLPVISSPELWKEIREFILREKMGDRILVRVADLRTAFALERPTATFTEKDFDAIIGHAQAQGLLWRLAFGDFVLVRPEILNDYASAVVRVARRHPEGLGCLPEQDVLDAEMDFEDLGRISDTTAESTLLHAVVRRFLEREVALREGDMLVFPSKFNRRPDYSSLPLVEVRYQFSGPIEDIYATLVVRLYYCGAFELKNLYRNAVEFESPGHHTCGLVSDMSHGEGSGGVSIFFSSATPVEVKVLFVRFVHEHLRRRSLLGSLRRERIYRCSGCQEEIENQRAVEKRLADGKPTIICQYCDREIVLFDLLEEKFADPKLLRRVQMLEEEVNEKRNEEVGLTTAWAKENLGEFDVFIAHNSIDSRMVQSLADQLKRRGLSPWLDVEQIPPGRWFQDIIQEVIPKVRCAAICISVDGFGKWQILEMRAFIQQCVEAGVPVIPVLLPGAKDIPASATFLRQLRLVHFRGKSIEEDRAGLDDLVWGITGKKTLASA